MLVQKYLGQREIEYSLEGKATPSDAVKGNS